MTKETVKVKVYRLEWAGDLKKTTISVEKFDKSVLKVDDWFLPQVGELCFNQNGDIDVVKSIGFSPGDRNFKLSYNYKFENSRGTVSSELVTRIEVKRGKVFIFNGKPFVHQEPLDGGYIKKMAFGEKITELE